MSIERIWRAWSRRTALLFCLAGCAFAGPRPPRRQPRAAAKPPARVAIQEPQALDGFFKALARLEAPRPERSGPPPVVRVLHFGDSHTAADFWPGRVRERLQARFGDGGPGLILSGRPWRGYPHPGVSILGGLKWPAVSLRSRECDGLVGLPGAGLAPVPGEPWRLRATFGSYRVHLLETGPGALTGTLTAIAEAEADPLPSDPPPPAAVPLLTEAEVRPGARLAVYGETAPADLPRDLSLWPPDQARLLGVDLLSGRAGVLYDELGLNGAEILDLDRWDPALRQLLLAEARPSLLVLAYGTNDMGMSAQALADYPAAVQRLLQDLKAASGAPILVVGPLDRLGRSRGQRPGLKAGAAYVIQALRQASAGAGCAFWDARQAMGGYGALLKWRRAGLAQPDLVHLNGGGYQKLGDLLAEALETAYDQYRRPAPTRVEPPSARPRPRPAVTRTKPAPPAPHHHEKKRSRRRPSK